MAEIIKEMDREFREWWAERVEEWKAAVLAGADPTKPVRIAHKEESDG